MRFMTNGLFFKQGTEKAHAVHDQYKRVYYIPKSQVKVVETIEPVLEYDSTYYVVEIPDWLCRRMPIFNITELQLMR